MKRALILLCTLAACGDDDAPMMECMSEAPIIECPMDMDLGCIEGTESVRFRPLTRGCGGGSPDVVCTPESGSDISGNTTVTCIATNDFGVAECSFQILASPGARLTCGDSVTAECAGERTPLEVPDPLVDEMCGEVGALTSDAPDEGFLVGDSVVRFDSAGGESCTVDIDVQDTTAPTIDCPESLVVVADSALEMFDAPDARRRRISVIRCRSVAAEPSMVPAGISDVTYTATDASAQSSTCSTMVDVRLAFAPRALRLDERDHRRRRHD